MRPSLRDVALGVTPAFSLGLAFGLGKIVRDCSLTCSVGYEWAPVGILAIALVSLPVLDLHVRLEARFGFRALAVGAFLAAAASFLVFRALTFAAVSWYHDELAAGTVHASGTTVRAVYLLFFVWLGAIAAVLGANAKMAAVRLHPPSFRGAALAWGAAAVVAGGLLGSAVAGPAAQWMMGALDLRYEDARDTLFFGMAAAVLLPIPALLAIGRGPPSPMASVQTEAAAPARALPSSVWSELVRIVRMNPTRRLAGLIFVSGIAETMIVFVFYWIVTEQTSQVHGRTMFFATYYVYVNGATLLMNFTPLSGQVDYAAC